MSNKHLLMHPDAFAQFIGQVIFDHRKQRSLTQEALGVLCGLDKSVISRVERGEVKVSVYDFHLICMAFDVPANEILPPFMRQKEQ